MSQYLKTLAKGAEWVFLGMIISKLLGYAYRLIVARIGVSEYGVISLGIVIVSILSGIAILGLDLGVLRYVSFYKAKDDEERARGSIRSAMLISGTTGLIFFIILFLNSSFVSKLFFGDENFGYIIKILSLTIPFYVLARLMLSCLKAFEKIKYAIYSENFAENILKILTALVFIYAFGMGITGAALSHVVAIFSVGFFSFYFLNKKVFKISGKYISTTKEIVSYSWPLALGVLSGLSILWMDNLMIGYLLKDAVKLGIYNAAAPTATLMLITSYAVLSLFTPIMSGLLAKKDKKNMEIGYKSVVKWSLLINLPLFLIMFVFSKDILSILFGEIYSVGGGTLSFLVIGYFFYTVLFASRNVLEVFKRTKLVMFNFVSVGILNIVLNYYLILRYDIIGAAISTAISLTLLSLMYLFEVWFLEGMNPFKKSYISILIINFGLFYLIYKIFNFMDKSILYFVLFGITFGVLYLGLLIKFKCLDNEELYFLKNLRKKLI